MGWWSAQCNDFTKVMITAGRARQHHKQCKGQHKERGHRSGSDGFSMWEKGDILITQIGDDDKVAGETRLQSNF
jgi:hypothetical protein